MDGNNYGQPGDNRQPSAPPAGYQGDVWPPPTTAPIPTVFPFKTQFSYVEGSVPNFRLGNITFSEPGITIQGKSVPRYEIQVPVLLASIVLQAGWLIAYLIMEYAVRMDEYLNVPWNNVRQIVLAPRKSRVCIVYDAPNHKGVVKTFSLTTVLDPMSYSAFAAAAQQYLPGRVAEGKMRGWTSPIVWVVCAGILLTLAFFGVMLAIGALAPPTPHTSGAAP